MCHLLGGNWESLSLCLDGQQDGKEWSVLTFFFSFGLVKRKEPNQQLLLALLLIDSAGRGDPIMHVLLLVLFIKRGDFLFKFSPTKPLLSCLRLSLSLSLLIPPVLWTKSGSREGSTFSGQSFLSLSLSLGNPMRVLTDRSCRLIGSVMNDGPGRQSLVGVWRWNSPSHDRCPRINRWVLRSKLEVFSSFRTPHFWAQKRIA